VRISRLLNRATSAPTIFDAARNGHFALDAPSQPWLDAGWISNFTRVPKTKVIAMRSGTKGAAQQQYRQGLDATIEFDMHDWGKLQMAISSGSQHMNLLEEQSTATPAPSVVRQCLRWRR